MGKARMLSRAIALTTINPPNGTMRALAGGAVSNGCQFFIAGDVKSPPDFQLTGATYLSIDAQIARYPAFCADLPLRHYTRKNVAYLAAIDSGADDIQETDDDNVPGDEFWQPLPETIEAEKFQAAQRWMNVYSLFSSQEIWPRGLPLQHLGDAKIANPRGMVQSRGLIRQGLADGNPDVDAVYRLTRPLPVDFDRRTPVVLDAGSWCPFNSQNTVYRREVFPLLYLPSKCSFRMTDIWRSFVAQRCLWEMGEGVVFHNATVFQDRNEHNILKDFEDEIPGYLQNDKIAAHLDDLPLSSKDPLNNLVACYESLVAAGFFPAEELKILSGWCRELERSKREPLARGTET